ncbi:MAG: hypothetical protein Q7S65_04100 [Nanoarchaeota archaeon]|nr:hypothetical protein [Nanoarchaeota archaeon]
MGLPMHENRQKTKNAQAGLPTTPDVIEDKDTALFEETTKLPETHPNSKDATQSQLRKGYPTHQFGRPQATGKIKFHGVVFRKFRSKRYQSGKR